MRTGSGCPIFLRLRRLGGLMRLLAVPSAAALIASPPAVRAADPQPYAVTITPTGDQALDQALKQSSDLVSLREKVPVPPFALITRADQDVSRFETVLHSFGYYDGTAAIRIDGREPTDPALPGLLNQVPAGRAVPVTVTPVPGPLYHIGTLRIEGQAPPAAVASLAPLHAGSPAVAQDVLAAGARLLASLRNQGHALAKVQDPIAILHKPDKVLDVTFRVDSGPRVDIGPITLEGLKDVNPGFVQRRLLLRPGEQYDPRKIEAARQDLASLGVFASVRVSSPEHLNPAGTLPITINFDEAKKHTVSLGAAYSTDLGFQGQVSWTDRNLFGNAEQLTLSASNTQVGGSASKEPGFDITAQFIKPDVLARDQSLQVDLEVIKESLDAYDRKAVDSDILLNRKVSPHWTVSGGIGGEVERITQEFVTNKYGLVWLPLTAKYDTTNSLLAPTSGVRVTIGLTPTGAFPVEAGQQNAGFLATQVSASTYLDASPLLREAPGRTVVALRGQVGSAVGASDRDMPPDRRFYAGGSATVRGFKYQSVGPQFPDGTPKGGLSIDAATIELRQRFLEHWGAAVFVDAGQVSLKSAPFTGTVRVGAGAGLRYYTPIGPIRLDVAFPVNRIPGGDAFELYIGLGEAF